MQQSHQDRRAAGQEWTIDRLLAEHDVTLESVVRVLARKGLVTAEELAQEEQARRQRRRVHEEQLARVLVEHSSQTASRRNSYRRPRSWLKRMMAKRRWTRRLGTFLFGWKWKKVYHRSSHHPGTNI